MASIVSAEGLSKSYLIGHVADGETYHRYTALRDVIARGVQKIIRQTIQLGRGEVITQGDEVEEFWALKDLTFDVKEGEVLGIVGRNGAGKSTLLKILSRITEPTKGRVQLRGRVASLLEVGTGFHPELTGRENIFLNGAILGMSRVEIRRKFDEIVAFSQVERFLDTPVKRYSSGMYVRLAFAVAAHLEPEILVVDEVLSVGDADFQRKCLNKLNDVAHGGRTVLFVSHNLNAVERLCNRVIFLEAGRLIGTYENARDGVLAYLSHVGHASPRSVWTNSGDEYNNGYFKPLSLEVSSSTAPDDPSGTYANNADLKINITGQAFQFDPALSVGIALYDENDEVVFWSFSTDGVEERWPKIGVGPVSLHAVIPARCLNEGAYRLELIANLHYRTWLFEPRKNAPSVLFSIQGGLSDSPYWDRKRPGMLAPVLHWESGSSVKLLSDDDHSMAL